MVEKATRQTSSNQVVEQAKLQLTLGHRPVPGEPFAMTVKGDCMEPELHLNDVIVCVPCAIPNDGDIVVIRSLSGFQLRRYVVTDGCHPFLVANNKTYATAKLGPEHEICGKVVDVQRRH
jgi:SOS-response transcriptional repressor LexA